MDKEDSEEILKGLKEFLRGFEKSFFVSKFGSADWEVSLDNEFFEERVKRGQDRKSSDKKQASGLCEAKKILLENLTCPKKNIKPKKLRSSQIFCTPKICQFQCLRRHENMNNSINST